MTHKIETKLNQLKRDLLKNFTLVLILRQLFIGFINFNFNNYFYVFVDGLFISILITFLFLELKLSFDFIKMGKISSIFLILANTFYGVFSQNFVDYIFYNSFIFALGLYLLFDIKKVVLLVIATLVVFPLNKIYSFNSSYQLILSNDYEMAVKYSAMFFSLFQFLILLYYYTEIKKNFAVITFLEEEERKSLEFNIKKIDLNYNDFYKNLYTKIDSFMKESEPWRNAEYDLELLAKDINSNIFQVSTAINYCNKSNFKTYLNNFRLNAIEKELKKSTNEKILLKEIYLEIGFNSRVTFNRTFKNKFGKTPQEYLSEHFRDENLISKE